MKDEKKLERTAKDPNQANSAGKESTEKSNSPNSTLQIIEGTVGLTHIPNFSYLVSNTYIWMFPK